MKLESLIIIFVIIIIPITIVLSEYTSNKITTEKLELQYNTKLLDATYDSVRAFQINNVNNSYSDISTSKVEDIKAAVNSFFESAETNFGFTGYKSDVMKEYVPAVVFTLYDGYYIYSPFENKITTTLNSLGVPELTDSDIDEKYRNGEKLNGLKPYVYYSCRYRKNDNFDFVITYTLDNYITIQGIVDGNYEYRYGYLIKDIDRYGSVISGVQDSYGNTVYNGYKKNGIAYTIDDKETLQEHADETNRLYPYAKINGIKYYLENPNEAFNKDTTRIFYYDEKGARNYSQFQNDETYKKKLYDAIKSNKSIYEYYKEAYGFTKWVNEKLKSIKTTDAVLSNPIGDETAGSVYGDNFIFGDSIDYEMPTSLFNAHRQAVIRYVVETNLSTAIAGYSAKVTNSTNTNYVMPKISENNWDIIENNVCAISFLQGLNIGSKKYNGYAVVPNALSKEYISENDIYILVHDGGKTVYCKPNDGIITNSNIEIKSSIGYYPGIWKIDFEQKVYLDDSAEKHAYIPNNALGSYTSIMGPIGAGNGTDTVTSGMYQFIRNTTNSKLQKAFYSALARERWGAYHVNNSLDLKYFLDAY